ncbi:hypothetical protein CONLIGDRAFT_676492 [Coniochaeta ligniaria NRRL 30616]|uniref:Uncharacterized protein n=1 Tax=Coniochaeta ligniaria NRRL 30616 TaxID=1408157 RepID=A0A1J7K5Q9_9PEZI|nr:hypothetical protein CONLIGDRAFT_676492 [Coniochaeta ligniaria NRRL 30616]
METDPPPPPYSATPGHVPAVPLRFTYLSAAALDQTVMDRLDRLEAAQARTEALARSDRRAPPSQRVRSSHARTQHDNPPNLLDRLEAAQARTEALLIFDRLMGSNAFPLPRRQWLPRGCWRAVREVWHSCCARRLRRRSWCTRWLQVQLCRVGCYWDLLAAKGMRFTVWARDILGSGGPARDDMAIALLEAAMWEKEARSTLKALRHPIYVLPR